MEWDGPRWGPAAGGAPRALVLLLHGVGADGFDLIDLAPSWGMAVPEALFFAPHAPDPCDLVPHGRQWFSLQDRTPARVLAGVRVAAAALEARIAAELARLGLRDGDLALMGFSQGAMTALFTGLRRCAAPACILAYSGALPGAETLSIEITCRPPVLIVHGDADPTVPVAASRAAESALRGVGVEVEAVYRQRLEHGIDEVGISLGALTLQRCLGVTPA